MLPPQSTEENPKREVKGGVPGIARPTGVTGWSPGGVKRRA